jgi:hypothetical protein
MKTEGTDMGGDENLSVQIISEIILVASRACSKKRGSAVEISMPKPDSTSFGLVPNRDTSCGILIPRELAAERNALR